MRENCLPHHFIFSRELQSHMTHGETRESNNLRGNIINAPQSMARVQVLVKIERMATLLKFFKKQSSPSTLALGNLNDKVQPYIRAHRKAGTPVNATVVIAAAEGIVTATDHTLLFENGGHVKLPLNWAYFSKERAM